MRCDDCLDCVSADLDGELDERERDEMDAHLAGCESCRTTAAAMRHQHRLLRLHPAEPVPDLTRSILDAVPVPSTRRWAWVGAAAAAVAAVAVTTLSGSPTTSASELEVRDARASVGSEGGVAEVYLYLSNPGDEALVVSVSTPLAERAEIHATEMRGQVATMVMIDSLDVPNKGATDLRPGGTHVMLVGLTEDVVVGESIPLTLHLQGGGAVAVSAKVSADVPAG